MTEEDHIQLLETIVHCSAQIMISGYDTPLYNDYLHTWDTYVFQTRLPAVLSGKK